MTKTTASITAVAGYVPDYILSNEELVKMVSTDANWIETRTGIKERRILKGEGLGTSDMAVIAIERLLKKRGITPLDIDMIIVASVTPDLIFPSTSNIICDKIGATNAWGFDLAAACSGFIFALTTGTQFIETGKCKKVIVVGADKMSSILDYTDRSTCIIFGDGAGAVLLEPTTDGHGVIDSILGVDGSGRAHLHQKAGGSVKPPSHATIDAKEHFVYQEGQAVFKRAVVGMAEVSAEIMVKNKLTADDVAWLVPHQANKRIIDATAERMGLSSEKVMLNIQKYGNTTAATIPLCLWDYEKQLKKGDNIILSTFGAGFTWGAIYVKWAYNS
ncbi:MAG: 3-oxoacyl-ACP synthase [Bacteroidetes bacterium RIFCSPLOWO2_12_FULL_35_15]|nr:MAG: 3-oxoacyl-ACP synthase [Bacteroidetes bacterium RIFCSPLOWO2_12_FULL_35_15]